MEEACEVCIFVALWLDRSLHSQQTAVDADINTKPHKHVLLIQVTQQTLAFLKMCGVKHWSNNNNRKKKEDAEKLQCLFGD